MGLQKLKVYINYKIENPMQIPQVLNSAKVDEHKRASNRPIILKYFGCPYANV